MSMEGKTCGKCDQPLSGSCINALGKSFHKDCWVCFECEGKIEGGFANIDDKPHCKDCATKKRNLAMSGGKNCAACDKPLTGSCTNAGDKVYHTDCFVCTDCKGSMAGGYVNINDKPYCKDCSSKHGQSQQQSENKKCSGCDKPLSGQCVGVGDKVYHENCAPERNQSQSEGKTCGVCNKALIGQCISSGETVYHKDCFKCAACDKVLGTGGTVIIDKKPHCKECAIKLQPSSNKPPENPCFACGKELSGTCIGAMDKKFHKDCFKCNMCDEKLVSKFRYDPMDPDLLYCTKCYPKRPGACTECGYRKSGGQYCGNCGTKVWTKF